jgi:hypothetical protein
MDVIFESGSLISDLFIRDGAAEARHEGILFQL